MSSWIVWGVVALLSGCGRLGFQETTATATSDGPRGDAPGTASNDGGPPPVTADAPTVAIDAAPGTLVPAQTADTYLKGIDATPNGGDADLTLGRDSGNGTNMYPVLRFDLTGLPATPVKTATLRLYQYANLGTSTMTLNVRRLTESWDEAPASWANNTATTTWTVPGGTMASTVYASASVAPGNHGYYDWNVTSLVDEWLTGASPNDGLEIVYAAQPPTGNYVSFASRENSMAAWHPQLLITP